VSRVTTVSRGLVLAILALALAPATAWAAGPALTLPITAVSFPDATHGYLSGYTGATSALSWTDNGGATWHASSITVPSIVAVAASADGSSITAVPGTYDALYNSVDNGRQWTPETSILSFSTESLTGVAYLDTRRVVVGYSGEKDALIASSVGSDPWGINVRVPVHLDSFGDPLPSKTWFSAIDAAPGGNVAWAVGNDSTLDTAPFDSLIRLTTDKGSTWATRTASSLGEITSVAAVDAQHAFIGRRSNSILRTTTGGADPINWQAIPITPNWPFSAAVNGIDALNADSVLAVGDGGHIAWSTNASADSPTWSVNTTATTNTLLGAKMIDANNWVVVGDHETILRTSNGGQTWTGSTAAAGPKVAITSPDSAHVLDATTISIEGTSSDGPGVGVYKVEVQLRNGLGQYWSGSAWTGTDQNWIQADSTDLAHGYDAWHKSISIPSIASAGGSLTIWARATDGLGTIGDKAIVGAAPTNDPTTRQSGKDRYGTAISIAQSAFPAYSGVRHLIIASGDSGHLPDALTAAGLAGVYNAPVLLVAPAYLDATIKAEIQKMPTGLAVHVIGGTPSVSASVYTKIKALSHVKSIERISGSDRYATAAAVARRMQSVTGVHPDVVLFTSGGDLFDPLIASTASFVKHYPVLLVARASVPAPTTSALAALAPKARYIVGSSNSVSDAVRDKLLVAPANRISGADINGDAAAFATTAKNLSWLDDANVGFAAAVPDAATGGVLMGRKNGPLLLVSRDAVPAVTSTWLTDHRVDITAGYIFGGPPTISDNVRTILQAAIN
jgi:putative cell wall-binding protein